MLLIDRPSSPTLRDDWSWGGRFKPRTAFLFYADARRDATRRLAALAASEKARASALADEQGAEAPEPGLPPLDLVEVPEAPINKVPD